MSEIVLFPIVVMWSLALYVNWQVTIMVSIVFVGAVIYGSALERLNPDD